MLKPRPIRAVHWNSFRSRRKWIAITNVLVSFMYNIWLLSQRMWTTSSSEHDSTAQRRWRKWKLFYFIITALKHEKREKLFPRATSVRKCCLCNCLICSCRMDRNRSFALASGQILTTRKKKRIAPTSFRMWFGKNARFEDSSFNFIPKTYNSRISPPEPPLFFYMWMLNTNSASINFPFFISLRQRHTPLISSETCEWRKKTTRIKSHFRIENAFRTKYICA